jgi:hypothetical protein
VIWTVAYEQLVKLGHKTSIPHSQETAGYGSRLIAFLNLFLKKPKISDRVRRKSIAAKDASKKIQKRL